MTTTKHLSAAISAHVLSYLPHAIFLMFLNNARFASDRIAMLLSLITHLKPSSRKNNLFAISDLTRLKTGVGESIIDFMSRVPGLSQRLKGVSMEKKIPPL